MTPLLSVVPWVGVKLPWRASSEAVRVLLDVGVEAGSLASEYANAVVLISDKNHNYRLMLSIGF
ncbi:hypothetical protein RB213_012943 [Colletotrichum asianum]